MSVGRPTSTIYLKCHVNRCHTVRGGKRVDLKKGRFKSQKNKGPKILYFKTEILLFIFLKASRSAGL